MGRMRVVFALPCNFANAIAALVRFNMLVRLIFKLHDLALPI